MRFSYEEKLDRARKAMDFVNTATDIYTMTLLWHLLTKEIRRLNKKRGEELDEETDCRVGNWFCSCSWGNHWQEKRCRGCGLTRKEQGL